MRGGGRRKEDRGKRAQGGRAEGGEAVVGDVVPVRAARFVSLVTPHVLGSVVLRTPAAATVPHAPLLMPSRRPALPPPPPPPARWFVPCVPPSTTPTAQWSTS